MKNYLEMVPRYIKTQRKRSFLIILGIALSVALVTAAGILAISIKYSNLKYMEETYGSYQIRFDYLTSSQIEKLKTNLKVRNVGISLQQWRCSIEDKGISLSAESMNRDALDMLGIALEAGSMPKEGNEVAVEKWILEELGVNAEVGAKLSLGSIAGSRKTSDKSELQGTGEYVVSGILKNRAISKTLGSSVIILPEIAQLQTDAAAFTAYAEIAEGFPILDAGSELTGLLQKDSAAVRYNEKVISAMADMSKVDWTYAFLAVVIVIAATIAIYNMIQISIFERIRQYGLLRSLGATRKQLRRLILREAALLSLISIPSGLIVGLTCIGILVYGLSSFRNLFSVNIIVIQPEIILVSVFAGLASIFVSVFKPARSAGRVSPMEALGTTYVVFKETRVALRKWHALLQKVTGISGKMAYQNLLRHRKRFVVTVANISVGITLFITFSYFVSGANTKDMLKNEFRGNYVLTASSMSADDAASCSGSINRLDGVEKLYEMKWFECWGIYKEGQISKEYEDYLLKNVNYRIPFNQKYNAYVTGTNFYGYSENNLELCGQYLVDGAVDISRMKNQPCVLLVNNSGGLSNGVKVTNFKAGDNIDLLFRYMDENGNEQVMQKNVTIIGIMNAIPVRTEQMSWNATFIAYEGLYDELVQTSDFVEYEIKTANGPDGSTVGEYLDSVAGTLPQGRVVSFNDEVAKLEAQKLQVSIVVYALIAIITMMGVLNIINTISAGLIVRTREFGMLRAVGMTARQLKRMILYEGFYHGLASSLFGTIAGSVLAFVLFRLLKGVMPFLFWTVPAYAIIAACLGSVLLAVLAGLTPMKRIASLNIVESIRMVE